MNKLTKDLRVGILGAAAGLLSISVCLLIARIDAYYAYLSWLDEETHFNSYDRVESLWWLPIAIWHLLLSITAALLVHRYLATRLRSPFLLWQVVGFASLLGWGLTAVLVVGIGLVMTGNLDAAQRTFSAHELGVIAKYVSIVFSCNVFYGSVMKASSSQYAAQLDEEQAC